MRTRTGRRPGSSAPPPRRRRSAAGITIVEMMIVVVILTVVMGGAFMVQMRLTKASAQISSSIESLRAHMNAVSLLRADLANARVESVAANGTSITYSLPVFDPITGSILDDDGNVLWGINDGTGPRVGGWCTVSFSFERTRSEAAEGFDLNGDGDLADTFDEGRLVKMSDLGARMPLPRTNVLLVSGNPAGDFDGDGINDRLFALNGESVRIRLARAKDRAAARIRPVTMAFAELK